MPLASPSWCPGAAWRRPMPFRSRSKTEPWRFRVERLVETWAAAERVQYIFIIIVVVVVKSRRGHRALNNAVVSALPRDLLSAASGTGGSSSRSTNAPASNRTDVWGRADAYRRHAAALSTDDLSSAETVTYTQRRGRWQFRSEKWRTKQEGWKKHKTGRKAVASTTAFRPVLRFFQPSCLVRRIPVMSVVFICRLCVGWVVSEVS